MNINNFKTSELDEYYNNKETVFFNYRRVYDLCRSNNAGYFFVERKHLYDPYGLPYTLRGRFHVFTEAGADKMLN